MNEFLLGRAGGPKSRTSLHEKVCSMHVGLGKGTDGDYIVRTWGAAVLRPYMHGVEVNDVKAKWSGGGSRWMGLNLNPHPSKAKGAAPRGRAVPAHAEERSAGC
jgi:hypothetical protein